MIHITKEKQRWDSIAYQYYGNATIYEDIIKANILKLSVGHYSLLNRQDYLTAGIKLNIPTLANNNKMIQGLPRWKR